MNERTKLLISVADIIKDYREGEIARPSPDHVDRWIHQFDKDLQFPLLSEIAYVFKQTYFSKSIVSDFFAKQIDLRELAGEKPYAFWQTAHILDIQKNGHSQTEIRKFFGESLKNKYGLDISKCGSDGGTYIYLDDILFTGGRIGSDLSEWIINNSPEKVTIHILVIAAHKLGEWQCIERLKKIASDNKKTLEIHSWAAIRIENRKTYRNISEVLWPATLPDNGMLKKYVSEEDRFPFEPRRVGGKLINEIFSSEDGRQLLERELLLAGMKIRGYCQNPNKVIRPLGFSAFGLGFGSMILTFRNCPNNCPLALWWGDPNASPNHPFSKWYPLLPRKTYSEEVDFGEIFS